ncbi:uncharacterized protein DS421_11g327650 [Arachis hypogaea]|nr:uncharacterized protein DS421_11g327650 [Arachis hypogaea]
MAACGESNEERSMKERLETPMKNEECDFILEQLEEALIVKEKEVVEDLRDAKPPCESRVVEYSSKKLEIDIDEDSAQPLRHVPYEELDGIDQEASSLGDDDHESSPPSDEFASASELFEFEEPSPMKLKATLRWIFVNFRFMTLVTEKSWTGVELTASRSLETSLPRSPSTPSFEWVKLVSLSFIVPLEYDMLKTDGQLRRIRCKGWYSSPLIGSRRMSWCSYGNSMCLTLRGNYDDQLEDGCRNKVWDPSICNEDQFWELRACGELH